MNLQIKDGRIGQSVLQRIPIQATITGMPNPDICTDIDVVGSDPVDGEGIMLNVEEAASACSTTNLPARPIEVPDSAAISHSSKGHIDGATARVGPVHRNIRNHASYPNWPGGCVVEPRAPPRIPRASP